MADNPETGLRHVPVGTGLAVGSRRSGLVARGRQAVADAYTHPHYRQGTAAYAEGRFPEAAACLRLAADAGHAESQYLLSTMLEAGEGIPADNAEAAVWERRAAEQGHAYAQANVSFRAYSLDDLPEAFAWCQRAAYSHLPWAQYHLGLMYRKGEGTVQSNAAAAQWYRLAADQDFPEAQRKLAELYSLGLGVAQSYVQAAHWYRRAAEQADAESQFQLGHLYAVAQGVEQDYVQSRHWIRLAARQGHGEAIRELKKREYRDA